MKISTLALAGACIYFTPAVAQAHTWTFCIKHAVHSADSNVGEDFEVDVDGDSDWISRGTKVRVQLGGTWNTLTRTSTSTGCTTLTKPSGGVATVEVSADHVLGNNENVIIKNDFASTKATKTWSFLVTLPNSSVTIPLTTSASDESNLAAIAPWVVHRVGSLTGSTGAASKWVHVYNQNCSVFDPVDCDGSAFVWSQQAVFISPDDNHSDRKFLVGHEMGHWLERWWGDGGTPEGGYTWAETEDACEFTGLGDHAMFSREDDFAAYKEGIAHFISAVAWNDYGLGTGRFKYYKTDAPYNNDLVELDIEGDFAFDWEESECNGNLAGKSVEGDWLRHFWNFLNDPTGTDFQPDLASIAALIHQMYENDDFDAATAYRALTCALADASQNMWISHWNDYADDFGVIGDVVCEPGDPMDPCECDDP